MSNTVLPMLVGPVVEDVVPLLVVPMVVVDDEVLVEPEVPEVEPEASADVLFAASLDGTLLSAGIPASLFAPLP